MTTQEHLTKIKQHCQELLAIAEKRTAGTWNHWPTHWAGGSDSFKYGDDNCPWINSDIKRDIVRVNPFGAYANQESMANAAFIASCAGAAEAGWRATIAAIEWLQTPGIWTDGVLSKSIIAAWPEELL